MQLTPEETRALLGSVGVALSTIKGVPPSYDARRAMLGDVDALLHVCTKLRTAVRQLEHGMARQHSDKVYLHVGLTPQAHALLFAHLERVGGGKIVSGSIGEYLSHVIVTHFKKEEEISQAVATLGDASNRNWSNPS